MIPQRFVTEYPARCMDLFELLEPVAREKQLIGSFSLIVATSVFVIPYERMKAGHPLNQGARARDFYVAIRRVERQRFFQTDFWPDAPAYPWAFSRIMNDVNQTDRWRDEQGLHPMAGEAVNTIERRTVNEVLKSCAMLWRTAMWSISTSMASRPKVPECSI